ncbi:MAG: hypothetical protein M1434_12775 [Chloroflexi bacterium]|nr:hypothetical protein [Chloroflexota bacterium]
MSAKSTLTHLPFATTAKNGTVFVIVSALMTLLVVSSAIILYLSQDEIARVQQDIARIDSVTSDLAALGAISNISSKGWISNGGGAEQVRGILNTLRQNKCCVLESDFAAGSLDTLNHVQVVLASEKEQILASVISNDANANLQTDMVNAYGSSEKLARSVSDIFVNWSSTFDESAREKLIKTAEDDTQNSLTEYTNAQASLDLAIDKIRSQVNDMYTQEQALKANLPGLQTRTYGSLAGLVIGAILLAAWILLRRQTMKPLPVGPVHEVKNKRKGKHRK